MGISLLGLCRVIAYVLGCIHHCQCHKAAHPRCALLGERAGWLPLQGLQ